MTSKPELITTDSCPFGLACAGIMLVKQIPFELVLVPSPPDLKSLGYDSPFGSVPLLKHGDHLLFDSIAICEYLADTFPLELHPADLARRAINRAWWQHAGEFTKALLNLCMTVEKTDFDEKSARTGSSFRKMESFLSGHGLFNGGSPSIIDSAYQPFHARHAALEAFLGFDPLSLPPRLIGWRDAVNATIGQASELHANHGARFIEYACAKNPHLKRLRSSGDKAAIAQSNAERTSIS